MFDISYDDDIRELTRTRQEDDLLTTYVAAYEKWDELRTEADCWVNPSKRFSMLAARIVCQDAELAYIELLRDQ